MPIISSPGPGPYFDEPDVSDTITPQNLPDILNQREEVTMVILPQKGIRGWLAHMERKLNSQRVLKELRELIG